MKTLAGIVLFNPKVDRLKENINAIIHQVDCLVLIENGSKNYDYIEILKHYKGIIYINNEKSMGIAYALNQILGYAYTHHYDWALTLDQDSVVEPNIITVYKSLVKPEIGIIGCWIDDRNFKLDESENIKKETIEVPWLITSASFTNVRAWKHIGGFDTNMFIDWVDWDICEAMHKAGYKIMRTYKTKLCHELGENACIKSVFGRPVYILHRPAFRYFYVFRNRIYMARKYSHISLISQIKENILNILGVLIYENHKCANLFSFIKGNIAGFFMPISFNSIKNMKDSGTAPGD